MYFLKWEPFGGFKHGQILLQHLCKSAGLHDVILTLRSIWISCPRRATAFHPGQFHPTRKHQKTLVTRIGSTIHTSDNHETTEVLFFCQEELGRRIHLPRKRRRSLISCALGSPTSAFVCEGATPGRPHRREVL